MKSDADIYELMKNDEGANEHRHRFFRSLEDALTAAGYTDGGWEDRIRVLTELLPIVTLGLLQFELRIRRDTARDLSDAQARTSNLFSVDSRKERRAISSSQD